MNRPGTPLLRRVSGFRRCQVPEADQIVRGHAKGEHPFHLLEASMTQLPEPADGLQPAEDLFHALALRLTDLVTRVSRRPFVDGAPSILVVLGHMRRDIQVPPLLHHLGRVIVLVAPDGHAAVPVASRTVTSTANPLRFSISTWPL